MTRVYELAEVFPQANNKIAIRTGTVIIMIILLLLPVGPERRPRAEAVPGETIL